MKALLILAFVTVLRGQDSTTNSETHSLCHMENPHITTVTVTDAAANFTIIKEGIERMIANLGNQGVPVETSEAADPLPCDCSQVAGGSGLYKIQPAECVEPYLVYCDMETDGGGWTVIQRREDSSVNFNRGWHDYQFGFGSKLSEHWLGNELLVGLTAQDKYELRVDMEDFNEDNAFAVYDSFRIGDQANRYILLIGEYSAGDAGDALSHHNRRAFTTPDSDNDGATNGNCAFHFRSGWWYANCYHANLNGLYRTNGEDDNQMGIVWSEWRGLNKSLKATEMKIRPISFVSLQ